MTATQVPDPTINRRLNYLPTGLVVHKTDYLLGRISSNEGTKTRRTTSKDKQQQKAMRKQQQEKRGGDDESNRAREEYSE